MAEDAEVQQDDLVENGVEGDARKRRTRTTRPFPAATFEDSLAIGLAIQEHGAGKQIRRLTLFNAMGRGPDTGPSRQMVTNSGKYGITIGSYAAEFLELTPRGKVATSGEVSEKDRVLARFDLAIRHVEIFGKLYENFKENKLPALEVLRDFARDNGIPEDQTQECVETFVVNCKFVGVLTSYAGAERFLTIEHVMDELSGQDGVKSVAAPGNVVEGVVAPVGNGVVATRSAAVVVTNLESFDSACFYISPIGHEGSEYRKHSDLFMSTFIEPVLSQFDLRLVRADKISDAGLITSQIIEYIVRSKLVIADLSFHNPNVFYEVALRHATRKPTIQLIRSADRIPFDVQPVRTITIDTTDIYTLVPQIEVYKTEIAAQVRTSLDAGAQAENLLSVFYPAFWSHLGV